MARHKALLIGASDYDEPAITSLPFVRDDLQRLEGALSERGFQPVEIAESPRGITPNAVNRHVLKFLRDAGRGDTLFIMLSGHGVHFEGADYLIPEDAFYEGGSFAESCVEIGWRKELEESLAGQVIFLVDACREGASRRTKAATRMPGWERPKIAAALRRKVAYVYACSTAQYALYVDKSEEVRPGTDVGTKPEESFSLFSRAVSDVVSGAVPGAANGLRLDGFEQAVQARLNALHAAYDKKQPVQRIRVETDVPWTDFMVLPGAVRDVTEHPWVRNTTAHSVWDRTAAGPVRDTLREICGALAARLAEGYETAATALGDDPWHDRELAKRTQERLGFLANRLPPGSELSPSEAALLVLLPLVGQAFWTHEAALRAGVVTETEELSGPERDRFTQFAKGFPRLKRRLRTLEQRGAPDGSVDRIRWWLFHRWLIRQPELYTFQALKALLGPPPSGPECPEWVRDTLSGERFKRLLQELRTAPFSVPRQVDRDPRGDHDVIAASTGDEHELRESLVASLLKAAHAFAMDPVDLPEILVEHIGISDSVDLGDLMTMIRTADWRTSGLGRSLNAVCAHQAVQIALREHARQVDALLRDINGKSALTPLHTLPPYADADRVSLSGNTPDHLSDGIRFQLAEDRVQELLMGEELYGERELAVRELYQNALDAVRYRDRRTEYLRRTGRSPEEWEGLIEFVQKADEQGRAYLECRDNGVGMGLDELSKVFSQGGTRFVDLPEYIDEQTAWAELGGPRLELHPNSRFGIGVLSYFMLADEIEVTTCRMERDGSLGKRLHVKIAGPGNLFRVEELGPGTRAGTTVRLLLTDHKERVSCVDTLRKVLWLAPYRTTAEHGSRQHAWDPDELSTSGPELDWARDSEMFSLTGACYTSDRPEVWWVDGTGSLLVDGLLAYASSAPGHTQEPYGAVLNLNGDHQPELSVDRKTIRSDQNKHVDALLHEALPSLFSSALPVLTPGWLDRVSDFSTRFADAVAEGAYAREVAWPVGDMERPFDQVGFFLPDEILLPLVTGRYGAGPLAHAASYFRAVPAPVLRWRLLTLLRAGLGEPLADSCRTLPPLPWARPSDHVLVSGDYRTTGEELVDDYTIWLAGPDSTEAVRNPSRFVLDSGILSVRYLSTWHPLTEQITLDKTLSLVKDSGRTASEVAERLTALGYDVVPPTGMEQVTDDDLPLLGRIGAPGEWLKPGLELSTAQICFSAARGERSTRHTAERLGELGFTVPGEYPDSDAWTAEEREVLKDLWRRHADPVPPDLARNITPAQLISIVHASGATAATVMRLLEATGFVLPSEYVTSDKAFEDDDLALLVYNNVSLDVDRDVPIPHVAGVAHHTAQTPEAVAAQLRRLGFTVPELPTDRPLPSRRDVNFLCERYVTRSSAAWPDPEVPLSLRAIASRAVDSGLSIAESASRLIGLGYTCEPTPSFLAALQEHDTDAVMAATPFNKEGRSIAPALLYATAEHVNRPPEAVARSLAGFGYEVPEIPESWHRERQAEADLIDALSEETEPVVGAAYDVELSLPTLASVAVRLRLPFRDVALKATALGMRHEAEIWFVADE
ncbi:HD domain-containing protein [Streptomyces liangshanensis]|uniref:HD domain-containing protein n=1 Tax=Streptomyces liangshanensis TaxID=2717324 RepID=UPI0036D87DFF